MLIKVSLTLVNSNLIEEKERREKISKEEEKELRIKLCNTVDKKVDLRDRNK